MALNVEHTTLKGFHLFRLKSAIDRDSVGRFVDGYLKKLLTDDGVAGVLFNSELGEPGGAAILELITVSNRLNARTLNLCFVPQTKLVRENPIWISRYAKLGLDVHRTEQEAAAALGLQAGEVAAAWSAFENSSEAGDEPVPTPEADPAEPEKEKKQSKFLQDLTDAVDYYSLMVRSKFRRAPKQSEASTPVEEASAAAPRRGGLFGQLGSGLRYYLDKFRGR